jgi:SAM-dependent methyltransferase
VTTDRTAVRSAPHSVRSTGTAWGTRARAWAEHEEQQIPTYEAAIRNVGIAPGMAVLDVGCGSGVFLRLAADRGARVLGLDASEQLVALARQRVPEADVRVGDMELLPYDDDVFDVVTGFNSFFLAADVTAALREAGRVAKPGASVVVQVWGRPERCALTALKQAVFPPASAGASEPCRLWKPGVLEEVVTEAGLTPRRAFDLRYPFAYPDAETLVRRMLAPPPVAEAVQRSGVDATRGLILTSLAPFRTPDGGYRLENEWHYLIATA